VRLEYIQVAGSIPLEKGLRLCFVIVFDGLTGKYQARLSGATSPVGRGSSLDKAIDYLEIRSLDRPNFSA
jgi:hypothetical protein